MFPIRDNNPTGSTAYVTLGLIVLNGLIFLFQQFGPVGPSKFSYTYGFIPAELLQDERSFEGALRRSPPLTPVVDRLGRMRMNRFTRELILWPDVEAIEAATALPAPLNIFSCMFVHGGWMHLIGNMLFLWIFGNNVEDRLGPWLYTAFYLGTGVCGNLAHTLFDPGLVPLVGASGAISGVMGAYILLFPRARILAIVPIGWYPATFSLPAWVYLLFYILLQNLWPASFGMGRDHVAYWAHIGGFVSGMALIFLLPHRPRRAVPQPGPDSGPDDADFVL